MKRTLVYNMRDETRRQNITLFHLSEEHVCKATQIFQHSVRVYESAASTNFGVQIHFIK